MEVGGELLLEPRLPPQPEPVQRQVGQPPPRLQEGSRLRVPRRRRHRPRHCRSREGSPVLLGHGAARAQGPQPPHQPGAGGVRRANGRAVPPRRAARGRGDRGRTATTARAASTTASSIAAKAPPRSAPRSTASSSAATSGGGHGAAGDVGFRYGRSARAPVLNSSCCYIYDLSTRSIYCSSRLN